MAGADYAFQRRKVGKQTRMTKHEVKQEHKQSEGDPMVKGAIRSRQLAAARNRMMADVPKADVVLVNPTHVAVALRYDPAAGAPRVVAKGAGAVAARIRASGRGAPGAAGPRRPAGPGAATARCQVGQEIPAELFAAVAQVLAFVISRRHAGPARRLARQPAAPSAELPAVRRGAGDAGAECPQRRAASPADAGPLGRQDGDRPPAPRTARRTDRGDPPRRPVHVPKRMTQLGVPIGVVLIIVMLVVPLPAVLLDLLIALNITVALLILLVAMFVQQAARLRRRSPRSSWCSRCSGWRSTSARPGWCSSTATPARSSRPSATSSSAARSIVGLIVFAILVIIQFVVITNGAGRVAEVGARFTLDAMPGKQMAIDADLNAGLIDDDEARRRRKEVARRGRLLRRDGRCARSSSRATRSPAIIITLVNLIGGFAIGVAQKGMAFGDAVHTYSLLTVGDGLVSQIPALLLSVATGLIVTRSTADERHGLRHHRASSAGNRTPLRVAGVARDRRSA